MRSGQCPKCGSNDVRDVGDRGHSNSLLTSWMRTIRLTTYICAHCGYAERYVRDKKGMGLVAQYGRRVSPQNSET